MGIGTETMKKFAAPLLGVFAALGIARTVFAQNVQHETTVINIEIPVRVFKSGVFIDNLTLSDFELYEDGIPQTVEAFYLVKKAIIERREAAREFAPRTARHFFLFFELGDYDPKIGQALEFFVKTVLLPGDNLTIVTPMKTYRMKGDLFGLVGREKTYAQVIGILRRDIQIGYAESRGILSEMTDLARVMASDVRARVSAAETVILTETDPSLAAPVESSFQGGTLEEQLMHYATLLDKLASLRAVDQKKLLSFAEYLRDIEGQKSVFFFYQREYVPKIDPGLIEMLSTKYSQRPDIAQTLNTLFGINRREAAIDVDFVKKAYADSSAAIHFLHVTRPPERFEGITMEEHSEDVFGPFLEMARATGGYASSSGNIAAAMKSAVEVSENYYLLYYTPAAFKADNRFHNVTVKVKNGDYRVAHRLGYIAN